MVMISEVLPLIGLRRARDARGARGIGLAELFIRISGMHDQFERPAVAQPDRREVSDVSCGEATDAEILRERYDRCVDETQAEIGISPINLHGPRKLIEPRRGVRECPRRQVLHEHVHGRSLIAQEVIDFRQHQTRNIPGPGSVDGLPKSLMIACGLDDVLE